jgi:hypothetical protein
MKPFWLYANCINCGMEPPLQPPRRGPLQPPHAGRSDLGPVRLAYQPPASSTFLSEQISHQQPANSTFLSEQISTSHQPPA